MYMISSPDPVSFNTSIIGWLKR